MMQTSSGEGKTGEVRMGYSAILHWGEWARTAGVDQGIGEQWTKAVDAGQGFLVGQGSKGKEQGDGEG